ncbi:MAG TPA: hypothetical protein VJB60_01980 [Candidatus Peribacterales bacterium]|nr:hypothetical protein [Candidatus Peribacterales bacterium]
MGSESAPDRGTTRNDLERHLHNVYELCLSSAELSRRNFNVTKFPTDLEPALRAKYLGDALQQFDIALRLVDQLGEQSLVERFAKYEQWFREMYKCILSGGNPCRRLGRMVRKLTE